MTKLKLFNEIKTQFNWLTFQETGDILQIENIKIYWLADTYTNDTFDYVWLNYNNKTSEIKYNSIIDELWNNNFIIYLWRNKQLNLILELKN